MIGQGPWVLGNGLLGTLEAYLSSSPMLLLTDFSDAPHFHAARALPAGDRRLRQLGRAARLRRRHQAGDAGAGAAQAVQATQLAIKHALAGQMGPVAVLFSPRRAGRQGRPGHGAGALSDPLYLPPPPPPPTPR